MMRPLSVLCLMLAGAQTAHAQAADSVRHVSAADLRAAVAAAPGAAPRAMYGSMIMDAGRYTVIQLRRTGDGQVEVHAEWDDVMVVQEGAATLLTGGEVSGVRQTAPGELRGGQITGAARRRITAGDVVAVPAGIPHQVLLQPGESITYLIIKARRDRTPAP
jgi:mannose-6-phosphate isomerase-like protein (cupin superfamily)